ncbi:MAG TPA: 2-C-methyl-D-erythritol 4-phosphate cytidylyltransferase, partial [Treponemataceae bacterium]|nr:2-C-methyl-D-erythritol 4-phosphate cytidylyltransferase [Treponemataceae bacterium]
MIHALLLTAAGSSVRMGGTKKEYLTVRQESTGTVSVLSSSLYAFLATGLFSRILITVPKNGETEARKILAADG